MADVTMTTYKRADGEPIWGEYDHVYDLEYFDDDRYDQMDTVVVKEVWVRTEVEEIHLHREDCFFCEKPWHGEVCDEEPDE